MPYKWLGTDEELKEAGFTIHESPISKSATKEYDNHTDIYCRFRGIFPSYKSKIFYLVGKYLNAYTPLYYSLEMEKLVEAGKVKHINL